MSRDDPDAAADVGLNTTPGDSDAAVTIRAAEEGELVAVMRVLDGALLEAEAGAVRERLAAGDVLVAEAEGRVVGALVLSPVGGDCSPAGGESPTGARIDAVAVRRNHRRSGTGRALVEAALAREGRLTAHFDPRVREFYEALGFDIEAREGRLQGVREADEVDGEGDVDAGGADAGEGGDRTRSR